MLPPSGETVLGEVSAANMAMGSDPKAGFWGNACEDAVWNVTGVTGDIARGLSILEILGDAVCEICPCARAVAMAVAALELAAAAGEEDVRGDPGGGGYPPEKVVAACAATSPLWKVTGDKARGLSIVFDAGGLAVTAPGPDGDLGGEIRLSGDGEATPPEGT